MAGKNSLFNDGIFSYDFVEARKKTVEWIEWNRIKADENIDVEIQTNIDIFLEKIISKLSPKNILFLIMVTNKWIEVKESIGHY